MNHYVTPAAFRRWLNSLHPNPYPILTYHMNEDRYFDDTMTEYTLPGLQQRISKSAHGGGKYDFDDLMAFMYATERYKLEVMYTSPGGDMG